MKCIFQFHVIDFVRARAAATHARVLLLESCMHDKFSMNLYTHSVKLYTHSVKLYTHSVHTDNFTIFFLCDNFE